jgi:hypothetical protein
MPEAGLAQVSSTTRLLSGRTARTVHALAALLRVSTLKLSTPVATPQASPSCRSTVLLDRGMLWARPHSERWAPHESHAN